jgi:WD40 repeat protein
VKLDVQFVLLALCVFASASAHATQPPITAIAFSPAGQSVVVASQVGVQVHGWPDLKLQRQIETSVTNVNDVAFSSDGNRLAIAGGSPAVDGTIEIVSWPDGKSLRVIDKHADSVMAVEWIDESLIATGSLDHRVLVCNTESGNVIKSMEGHSRGISTLCFLRDKTLVSAGVDQSLRVWDIDSGELQRSLSIHTQPIHSLALRPEVGGLPMLASASDDRTVRLWQPTIGRMVRLAKLKSKPLCADWLPDGSQVVVGCTNGHVYFIDPDSVEVTRDVAVIDGWAYSLAMHPSDGKLLVGGSNGQLRAVVGNL